MNKKEMSTILNTYKEVYQAQEVLKIDKSETIRTFKFMLDNLNLKKERYIIENEVITERDNIGFAAKGIYEMIFETFAKYGRLVHYDLKEIENYYDDLQYVMSDEDNKCHNARINYILSNKKAA